MIDVHCHLTSDEFSVDLDAVLSRSVESGVTHLIAVSMDAKDARDAQALSLRFPFLYYGVGFHPEKVDEKVDELSFDSASFRDAMESFERSFADQKTDDRCVCIGEVGIDHARRGGVEKEELKKDHQRLAFELACKLSRESNSEFPLNVHSRGAGHHAIEMMEKMGIGKHSAVLHAFDGKAKYAKRAGDLGFAFSVAPVSVRDNDKIMEKALSVIPRECILLESDAPALAPIKGERNVPGNISVSRDFIARVLNMNPNEVESLTVENTFRVFPKLRPTYKLESHV